ncbi:MAG: GntR family transcriptional regulator, partial [Pseudomonadota bacterium]
MTRKKDCLDDLRHRILTQDIAPGSDLDEAALADHYQISRTPLREVFQRLAGSGYLTLAENRGAKVASMDLATMRTFFQTAPLIYSSIARLAAENRTGAQLEALKSAQTDFAAAVAASDAEAMALNNHLFHEIIGEMAHNDYLMASLRRLLIDHTRLGQMFYRPSAPAENVAVLKASQQHDGMIAAIEARETGVITELTLQHWDLSRDRLERFVRPDPLPLDV